MVGYSRPSLLKMGSFIGQKVVGLGQFPTDDVADFCNPGTWHALGPWPFAPRPSQYLRWPGLGLLATCTAAPEERSSLAPPHRSLVRPRGSALLLPHYQFHKTFCLESKSCPLSLRFFSFSAHLRFRCDDQPVPEPPSSPRVTSYSSFAITVYPPLRLFLPLLLFALSLRARVLPPVASSRPRSVWDRPVASRFNSIDPEKVRYTTLPNLFLLLCF